MKIMQYVFFIIPFINYSSDIFIVEVPSQQKLEAFFTKHGLQDFIEQTTIVAQIAGKQFRPFEVCYRLRAEYASYAEDYAPPSVVMSVDIEEVIGLLFQQDPAVVQRMIKTDW